MKKLILIFFLASTILCASNETINLHKNKTSISVEKVSNKPNLEQGIIQISAYISKNKIIVEYHIPPHMHQMFDKEYFNFKVSPVPNLTFSQTNYPLTTVNGQYGKEYRGLTILSKTITGKAPFDKKDISIAASYQTCLDSGTCIMPQTINLKLPIPKSLREHSPHSKRTIVSNNKISSTQLPLNISQKTHKLNNIKVEKKENLIYMILLAFLGGIILNLMPCVLPVLSIKMLSIVNSAHHERKHIMICGFIYIAGILISFTVLASVVVMLKHTGESIGWGFQFQNPYFVFFLMLLIWAFALSLFEVFTIHLPGMQTASKAASKKGMLGTFMSGVFAVLLATPCSAPLLGTAVAFALRHSAPVIYIIMLTVGVGLAFPFIVLAFCPKGIMKIIPKPGNWMNIFSEVMGFMLVATAVFLCRSLFFIVDEHQFINALWFMVVFSFALWLYGKTAKTTNSSRKQWIALASACTISLWGFTSLIDFSFHPQHKKAVSASALWQPFSPKLLEEAREQNKPVFIDFYAEWCVTCKANEALVLHTQKIEDAFKKKNVILMQGDFTRKDPIIFKWLQKYKKAGVPLYLLYIPSEKKPIVFPELITKKMILKALDKI